MTLQRMFFSAAIVLGLFASMHGFRPYETSSTTEARAHHNLRAVTLAVGANANISKLIDNQAEATMAIDPTKTTNLFSASVTWHGSLLGQFDATVDVPNVFKDHTPGVFVAYSNDPLGPTWKSRIMATGGPTEANDVERSLPSASSDPQAVFDDFGNLYLTYLSQIHQFGKVTAGGGNVVTDNTRKWVPNMWAGRIVTIRVGKIDQEAQIIKENTANTLTITGLWNKNPAPGDAYKIEAGILQPGLVPGGNAIAVLLSTDGGQNFQFLNLLDSSSSFTAADYPAIATGPGSKQNEKSVWLAWRGGNNMVMAIGAPVTAQGAVGPFLPAETVNGSFGMGFPRVQVGPNGQVMVSFQTVGGAKTQIFVNVDDDGLGPNGFRAAATPVTDSGVVHGNAPPFFKIPAQNNRGISPQANLAWDRSGTYRPAPDGRVYIAYTDLFQMLVDTDIYFKSSDDSGKTWSLPKQVSGLNFKSQFLPSIAVDQTNGDVAVVWLDARNDPANVKVQLFGTLSGDGGANYEVPVQIAKGQSDATKANARQLGSSTGSTKTTLTDAAQKWTVNDYWRTNFEVSLPNIPDRQPITANTATQLTVAGWFNPNNPPPVGTAYQIQNLDLAVLKRTMYNFDYGEYTGLAFQNGVFYAVWADNSNSTNDNPEGANASLDLYTAAVTVTHNPGAGNVENTRAAPVRRGRVLTRRVP